MYLLWLTLIFFNKMNRVSIIRHFYYYWGKAGKNQHFCLLVGIFEDRDS